MKRYYLSIILFVFMCHASTSFADNAMIANFYDPSHELSPQQLDLLEAAVYDKQDKLKQLLDQGIVFDWKLKAIKRAWIEIVLNKRKAVIDLLLNAGMDINAIDLDDVNGRSALMEAAVTDVSMVDLLLQKGAKVDLEDKNGETALFTALWPKDNQAIVARLIKAGADVNHINHNKETPLLRAIKRGNKEAVALLLEAKADIEYNQRPRETPLIVAAQGGFAEIVALLLDKGARINAQSPLYGTTALMEAANRGQITVVKLLLERGADPSIKLANGEDAFKLASESGHADIVKLFLEKKPIKNGAVPSTEIVTQMFNAITQGHAGILETFLNQGYDINTSNEQGDTLLIAASREGQLDMAALLLQRGVGIETANHRGEKAVDAALWKGDANVLKLLLDHGAQKPTQSINGMAPFLQAVYSGNIDLVKLMLSLDYDINQQDSQGMSPVHIAASVLNDNGQILELLLSHKTNIESLEGSDACKNPSVTVPVPVSSSSSGANVVNSTPARMVAPPYIPQCETPLIKAVASGHLAAVKILLGHGANINAQSPVSGTTPLIEAAFVGDPDIVQLLLDHGANINLKNKEGQDALAVAQQKTNTKAVAILKQAINGRK